MDPQKWMDVFPCHGEPLFEVIIKDSSDHNSDGETSIKALADFSKNKFTAVTKSILPLTPDPLPLVPPEIYRPSIDELKRRRQFFKHLSRYDILYLQVIDCDDKEYYKCLAFEKQGDILQIDDLCLVFYYPKFPSAWQLIVNICKFDLIRGAFWSCDHWKRKMFVTTNISVFDEEERQLIPRLGKIRQKDLPHYIDVKKIGISYKLYVERSAGFRELDCCPNRSRDCLGTDATSFSSFFEKRNKKTYPASESLTELQKKLRPNLSLAQLTKSFEYFRTGDMFHALYYANKALRLNPDNIEARVTRGTIYANLGKLRKAFIDTEDSLKIDPNNEKARKQMSELLVSASRIHLLQENFLKWHESLVVAKNYNPDNHEVEELLSKIKYETLPADATNPEPVKVFTTPLVSDVTPIYKRIALRVDKARLIKQFKKQLREKRKHDLRLRIERLEKQTLAMRTVTKSQPIPVTTSRRPIFRKPRRH